MLFQRCNLRSRLIEMYVWVSYLFQLTEFSDIVKWLCWPNTTLLQIIALIIACQILRRTEIVNSILRRSHDLSAVLCVLASHSQQMWFTCTRYCFKTKAVLLWLFLSTKIDSQNRCHRYSLISAHIAYRSQFFLYSRSHEFLLMRA